MNIIFENDTGFELSDNYINQIKRVCIATLKRECFSYPAEISITIVDNDSICILNKKFRKINAPTDVLSFPLYNFKKGDYSQVKDMPKPISLGDIVISIEKAISQSTEYGHSLLRELAFLTVHSMLHLLGYDHKTNFETEEMFRRQGEILDSVSISR